jgi:tetratricopeptide (TPR) repeat protein
LAPAYRRRRLTELSVLSRERTTLRRAYLLLFHYGGVHALIPGDSDHETMASIFISLAEEDTRIAEALRDAFRQLFGDTLHVYFSTSEELRGGIRPGQDWYQWIVERVLECDFALILLTPSSIQSHWVIWEAGAVYGASLAAGKDDLRKVRPLRYQLEPEQLPSPIRESKVQSKRGDRAADIKQFLKDVVDEYRAELAIDTISSAFENLNATVDKYLAAVAESLMDAPSLATSVVIEEWRIRLDRLLDQNRQSEAEYLHDWMDIAFGRSRTGELQPLDLRIHSRLADLYLKARKYPRAIEQLQLARVLAPRDIFVLRTLGRAYLDSGDRTQAKAVSIASSDLTPTPCRRTSSARRSRPDGIGKERASPRPPPCSTRRSIAMPTPTTSPICSARSGWRLATSTSRGRRFSDRWRSSASSRSGARATSGHRRARRMPRSCWARTIGRRRC